MQRPVVWVLKEAGVEDRRAWRALALHLGCSIMLSAPWEVTKLLCREWVGA